MSKPMQLVTCLCALVCLAQQRASAQTVIFQDDFESGSTQWSMDPEWHLSTANLGCWEPVPPPPSGSLAARFGMAGICAFGSLAGQMTQVTPVAIPARAQAARLRFMSFERTECGIGNCGWDHRSIRVSADAGQTWDLVWEGGKEGLWIEKSVDLSSYIGQDVLIGFLFEPIDGWGNNFAGWLVDDVAVEIDEPGGPVIYCTSKVNSMGCAPLMSYAGSPSLSGSDDLQLTCTNVRNQVWGSFAWNTSVTILPFQGGTLCVKVPARRTTTISSAGNPSGKLDCSGSYTWHFSHAYLAVNGVTAGETVYCQYFARDSGSGAPMSLSNAVAVTILP